ncbi:MAG: bifunctional phosphopantothenoylcysteine decarboxylase/phosphopantothenate--cysteine ligase CoaBC [Bdellovibrionaceae bacterium]|nr:bifunctional phosphopantothenoylcysteine decarboxylase/phosphopantothenate--cysteine ligase CoaBC [Pseudobdellovibrionaceae bacterium]
MKVLVMMTGSIACYKACAVLSRLKQRGHELQVMMSEAATKFIGPATIEGLVGCPPVTDTFASGHAMDHIHLMRWADVILVAPATANAINSFASGAAQDLIGTSFLAHDFKRPLLLAPAMNQAMYQHPATQRSIKTLRDMGVQVLETESGVLACGEEGPGRLLDPELIAAAVENAIPAAAPSAPVERRKEGTGKILLTAGATVEKIDRVRSITNFSTGRTGVEIAKNLFSLGFDVTLLLSESATVPRPSGITTNRFSDTDSLNDLLRRELATGLYQTVVHAAAVSDYRPEKVAACKISSTSQILDLRLIANKKILHELRSYSPRPVQVIGFKLTAGAKPDEITGAVNRVLEHADAVVHNDMDLIESGKQFFTVFTRNERSEVQSIEALSAWICRLILLEVSP